MPKLDPRWIRATGTPATWIPGHLRRARMATTPITLMHARPTVTMDLAGFRAESLLAWGPGAGVGAASLGDLALAGGATMEAGGPFPGAEDFAVGSVTVTPVEADVASVVVDVASVAAGVASVVVDMPSVAVDVASVAVDIASVEADMATVEAEAEADPMVGGAGRFRHNLKLSRPTAFAVGRFVGRRRLRLLERIWGRRAPFLGGSNDVMRGRRAWPLFALSVAFLDDPVEIVHGVRLILNRQGSGPLIGGQTFLQCEVGVFLPGPRTCQQSAIHCLLLQGTIQGQLPGSERLGRTQKFLRPAGSNSEQQPSTFMNESFSHAESQVRQTIHL